MEPKQTGAKFVIKTLVPPEKFAAHLNTLDGLGYELETMVPNDTHDLFTLMFRRRPAQQPVDYDIDFEAELARLAKLDPTQEAMGPSGGNLGSSHPSSLADFSPHPSPLASFPPEAVGDADVPPEL